jgi:hypothetical protein
MHPGSPDAIPSELLAAFQRELSATVFGTESMEGQSGALSTFLVPLERTAANKDDVLFPFNLAHCSLRDHFVRLSSHARLAIYRGIIISLPRDAITTPFAIE